MAKRSRTSSSLSGSNSFPTHNSSVDSAWREALAFRDLGSETRVAPKKRLAQAQVVRAQAESEAITATKNFCADARAEADLNLMQAGLTMAEAERTRADAKKWVASMEEEIQFRLDDAAQKRSGARVYASKIEDAARGAADALMDQTRAGAEELANRMRSESAGDIRKILADIEMARASAEDELETQRLLTETARVRAFSAGLTAQGPVVEPVNISSAPKAKQGATKVKAAPAKRRAAKSTSARKAA